MTHNFTNNDTFPITKLLSTETGASTETHDSSSDTTDFRLRQEPETHSQENDFSASEITLKSVGERIKQATDPVLRRVEELCALLASWTELESPENNGMAG